MAANKRTPNVIKTHRSDIAKLMRQGETRSMIAERLGLPLHTVDADMRALMVEFRGERAANIDELVLAKDEEYAHVKRELWESWHLSKIPKKKAQDEDDGEATPKKKKSTSEPVELQPGNPAIMSAIISVLQDERKLHGIDTPARKELVNPDEITDPEKFLEFVLPHVKQALDKMQSVKSGPELVQQAEQLGIGAPVVVQTPAADAGEEFDLDAFMEQRKHGAEGSSGEGTAAV